MTATVLILVLGPLGFWWLGQRRWKDFPPPGISLPLCYGAAFLLPLVIPYRILEKFLYNYLDGLEGAWLISALVTAIELIILTVLIDQIIRRLNPKRPTAFFPFWLLIGLGFGLGKIARDALLVIAHPLSRFYEYSQFSTFMTVPFLVQRLLEIIFVVIACSLLAMGRYREIPCRNTRSAGFFLLSFIILQLESIPRLLFQFVPLLSLFMQAYLVSLLPILCILTMGILWYVYRREGGMVRSEKNGEK